MKSKLIVSTSMLALFALTGCQEYLHRSDFIDPSFGDAVSRNASNQTIDPWPRYVYDTNIRTSAKRQADAVEAYENANEPEDNSPGQLLLPLTPPASPSK